MDYEWDDRKRQNNILTHGVDFILVQNFDWANCLTIADERFDEYRYSSMGKIDNRLYVLVYTVRENTTRIISMRKANKREVKKYDDYTTK